MSAIASARSSEARSVRVVGIGNPDRGDDGIGALVAAKLAGRLPADVEVVSRRADMMTLADDMAHLDALVCVDACAGLGMPGRVRRIDWGQRAPEPGETLASSHALGLAEAVALARALDMAPGEIVVYAIEGACFDTGAPITPEVSAVADTVAARIVAEVERIRGGSGSSQ